MAISQAVANAILGQRAPDILGSFEQGQEVARGREERSRARQIQELSGQAYKGDAEAFGELQGIAPEVALELQNKLNIKDKGGLDRLYTDARTALSIYENYGVEGVISFGENRIQGLKSMFADTQDTERALNFFKTGNIEEGVANLKATISALEQAKSMGPTAKMQERMVLEKQLDSDDSRIVEAAEVALGIRARPSNRLSIDQEKELYKKRSEGRVEGGENEARQQGFINKGVEAADSTANLRRTIALLDEIKTGGLAAANLKAKRALGIEGASEGELANALGVAVLAQLKPIFGAAFTVGEVERLEALSAGFGKSQAANRRILESALKISTNSARRGIRAAEARGDDQTANEIRAAMEFSLDPIEEASTARDQPQDQDVTFLGYMNDADS